MFCLPSSELNVSVKLSDYWSLLENISNKEANVKDVNNPVLSRVILETDY